MVTLIADIAKLSARIWVLTESVRLSLKLMESIVYNCWPKIQVNTEVNTRVLHQM